jgi:hypothetical protein
MRREVRHVATADANRARHDPREAVDRMQHRRLPGPVGTDEAKRLAATKAKVESVQDFHVAVAGEEPVDRDERFAAGQRRKHAHVRAGRRQVPGRALDFIDRQHDIRAAEAVSAGGDDRLAHQCPPR